MINSSSPLLSSPSQLLLSPLFTLLQSCWPHLQTLQKLRHRPALTHMHSSPLCLDHFVLPGPIFYQAYAWPFPQYNVPWPFLLKVATSTPSTPHTHAHSPCYFLTRGNMCLYKCIYFILLIVNFLFPARTQASHWLNVCFVHWCISNPWHRINDQ